jgi:hypothetical protein
VLGEDRTDRDGRDPEHSPQGPDAENWWAYQRARSRMTRRAPASPTVEAGLIAIETFISAIGMRRPMVSTIATASATRAVSRLRWHAESARGRELGLTAANAPSTSTHQLLVTLALLPARLLIGISQRRRGIEPAPADWSLLLASKVVREIDRRRSWRLAGGPSRPSDSAGEPAQLR